MRISNLLKKITIKNLKKGTIYLRQYGFKGTFGHFVKQYQSNDREYEVWQKSHTLKKSTIDMQKGYRFAYEPLVSILVPVYNTPLSFLKEMIESVCEQTYDKWELCIANASPDNVGILELLTESIKKEKRIRVVNIHENLGIAGNTNAVLHIAKGEYVGLLDHDDVLSRDALFEMVKKINEENMPEVIYSDEDKINEDGSRHFQPHFKPDFNLDLLRSNNYICHFFVVKRMLLLEIGGFRKECNGAQDYDLILRSIERTDRISHIPKILYHWRIHDASTSDNPESKRYAYDAGKKAIQEHLKRCGENGRVGLTQDRGFYRVKYVMKGSPLLSIIVLCKNGMKGARTCIQSIRRSAYPNLEFLIVGNNIREKIVPDNIESNIFASINSAVKNAKGQYLLLISENVKMADRSGITELLANCQRDKVGIVGGKLYNRDGKIHNAGLIVRGDGFTENIFAGLSKYDVGYMHRESLQQNLSAVSIDCMMVKRKAFEEVEGFDVKVGNTFAAVDFCLRVGEKGFLVVFNPHARLYYLKRNHKKDEYSKMELKYMKERWKLFLEKGDPAYNPNLASKFLFNKD